MYMGVLCCFALFVCLFVCLTLLACFSLSSFSSLINRLYIYAIDAFSHHERLLPLTAIDAFLRQTNGPRLDACN